MLRTVALSESLSRSMVRPPYGTLHTLSTTTSYTSCQRCPRLTNVWSACFSIWASTRKEKKSRQNLKTLRDALDALSRKRDLIRRFFVTAHRLGQSLEQKKSRGFTLSTLEKLTQTKSTARPNLSILHFVLALMRRAEAQELFTDDDIAMLKKAKDLGTSKVRDDCLELAQGLYGVKQICESGEYTCQSTGQSVKIEKRRKTMPSRPLAAAGEDGKVNRLRLGPSADG